MKYKFKWEEERDNGKRAHGMTPVSQSGFYNTRSWNKIRNAYIREYSLCESCKKKGRYIPAKYVDHIIPLTPENVNRYGLDWDNLQSLCSKCHQVKTNRSKAGSKYSPMNIQKGKELQSKINTFNHE